MRALITETIGRLLSMLMETVGLWPMVLMRSKPLIMSWPWKTLSLHLLFKTYFLTKLRSKIMLLMGKTWVFQNIMPLKLALVSSTDKHDKNVVLTCWIILHVFLNEINVVVIAGSHDYWRSRFPISYARTSIVTSSRRLRCCWCSHWHASEKVFNVF